MKELQEREGKRGGRSEGNIPSKERCAPRRIHLVNRNRYSIRV